MLQAIKNIFGMSPKADYSELMKQGATILDVRTRAEFAIGHIEGAINIPLDELSNNPGKLKNKNKCIICCCASGMRSGTAKRILESKGYKTVVNGGGWSSLRNKL